MNYNNYHFKKLLIEPINNLINQIINSVQYLSPIKNESYKRNVKYSLRDYVIGIIDVTKNYTSWNSYNGFVNKDTLRIKFNEWVKLGVFEHAYKNSLKKYIKTTKKTEELKYQSIDSTFVEDINGSKYTTFSGIYKRRKGASSKGIKITSIVTTNGIPISITINQAHQYDSPLLPNAVDKRVIDCDTKKYNKHNRYKQYLLADSGYDSKKNHKKLINEGYIPIIKQNKRNIKNEKLKRIMNIKQKKIYKKRTIIENYHSWIKKFAKVKSLYERKIKYYKGLLLVGISLIIHRRIIKNKK
jgi:hypothetical protein